MVTFSEEFWTYFALILHLFWAPPPYVTGEGQNRANRVRGPKMTRIPFRSTFSRIIRKSCSFWPPPIFGCKSPKSTLSTGWRGSSTPKICPNRFWRPHSIWSILALPRDVERSGAKMDRIFELCA